MPPNGARARASGAKEKTSGRCELLLASNSKCRWESKARILENAVCTSFSFVVGFKFEGESVDAVLESSVASIARRDRVG